MVIIPEQKRTFLENLESKALGVTVSLRDVAAGAVFPGMIQVWMRGPIF
jgi:hypothetical protein